MSMEKEFETIINLSPAEAYTPDLDETIMYKLAQHYNGYCSRGYFIDEVLKIIRRSECEVSTFSINGDCSVSVMFVARVRNINVDDIILVTPVDRSTPALSVKDAFSVGIVVARTVPPSVVKQVPAVILSSRYHEHSTNIAISGKVFPDYSVKQVFSHIFNDGNQVEHLREMYNEIVELTDAIKKNKSVHKNKIIDALYAFTKPYEEFRKKFLTSTTSVVQLEELLTPGDHYILSSPRSHLLYPEVLSISPKGYTGLIIEDNYKVKMTGIFSQRLSYLKLVTEMLDWPEEKMKEAEPMFKYLMAMRRADARDVNSNK